QLQAKDTTICKLKEHIKSMKENDKEEKVKHEMNEIETMNIELEHSVAKLLYENERLHKEIEHLKKIYKDQFDSIRKSRALSKEHGDSLIAQLNSKSMENADLKHQLQDKVESSKTSDSNTHVLSSTGLKCSTSTYRSQPTGNKKNDRILQKPSSNKKNKVEAQPRKVNKKNRYKEPICDDNVKHTMLNANSQLICVKCKQCMFDANHDVCFLDFVNGLKWKPTGRLFTIVGNSFPLTRITPKKIVHLKETTSNSVETPKPKIKVYSRRPKQIKSVGLSKKSKIIESKIANNLEPNDLCGSNATDVPSSSSLVNDRLSRSFSSIWTPDLAKDGLARGIPKLKFQKDHLCSECTLGKSKKSSYQPKAEDTNQEKLYLLHMDLCGPMRVESINGKKYILVIVDDYSRFTWVRFLRSKDETPNAIIKYIKNIQVHLNVTVRNVRTDNGTEFVNQTLCDFYENVGILHQTFVARTP
ncbi:retrovirus-related pol polyprotein from transposon TNT 1-94, partial [Tanacetum coccineum]